MAEAEEVTWHQLRALVEQLVERVLPVGPRFTPYDRAGLRTYRLAVQVNMFAVALHLQLLQVGRKASEMRRIGHHAQRLRAKEVIIPDSQQAKQKWQILLRWGSAEVFVHRPKARQHVVEPVGADRDHGR